MTAYKNAVLIYNPRAGRFGRSQNPLLQRAVEVLTSCGHRVTVVPTLGPETAGPIARHHVDRGADLIIGAGGDGTVNEILQGMIHSEVPLAVLPGGTANVLAMEMRLGKSIDRVARRIGDWRSQRISAGHVKCSDNVSRYFLLMAGVGLDARIVYQVSAALKARTGKFAYWVAGWSLVGRRLPQMHAEIGGTRRQCSFALVSKVRNYGGDFEIARSVSLFDDEYEAVLFEGKTSLPYIKYFAGMALNRLEGMKGVTILRSDSVRLTCPGDARVYVQVDGEFTGRLPAEITIVPNAVNLLIPPDYEKLAGRSAFTSRQLAGAGPPTSQTSG